MRRPKAQVKLLACALLLGLSTIASGQDNRRAVTIVAPAAPGGGWDQTARVMQHVLRESGLASSVQVINAPGAAGTIGLARFVSSEHGNPNALLVTGLVMVSGIAANRSPVTLADATPIARLSGEYEVVVVPRASPYRSLRELVAAFRANPRAISWGGGSAGGTDELLVRLLADRVGVDRSGVNYIAYSGGGQVLASVLGAHVTAAVSGLGEFTSQVERGELRALAISAPERLPGVAIPTFREAGVDLVLLNWRAVVGPPGLTRPQHRELEALVRRMAITGQWKTALQRHDWADIYMDGDAFRRFLSDETARIAPLVGDARTGRRGSSGFELFVLLGSALAVATAAWQLWSDHRTGPREQGNAVALTTLSLALLADIAVIESAGFVLASAVMFVIAARAFGSRRIALDAAVGVALAAIVYVAFARGLGVTLPRGPFG